MLRVALICPAVRPTVSQLAETGPLVTAPILGECLVNHWIENVAALGATDVTIFAADRPDEVRRVVGDGRRWGVRAEVRDSKIEVTAAELRTETIVADSVVMLTHLPGSPDFPLFETYSGWFSAIAAWIPSALTPARVRLSEVRPGIWMSRRAHVSPRAQLIAPCWIGDQVIVRHGAVIGPGAILEDRAVVDSGARVVESIIGEDTYVGRMTSVANSIALGETLINWKTDSWLRVPDPFLLCSLARANGRGVARSAVAGIASLLARFSPRPADPPVPAVPVAERRTTQ